MKPYFTIYFLLFSLGLFAQNTISGNFTPAEDFKWLIVYKLTPSGQNYITDTSIIEGAFEIELPSSAQSGIYRLVYAVPQDEFYIDLIYNNKEEAIAFNFSLEEGIVFTDSDENKWYNEYLAKISVAEEELASFYELNDISETKYLALAKTINEIQNKYEKKYQGTIAHNFIKANRSYIPKEFKPLDYFTTLQKEHYFDPLDLDKSILQSSNFLIDKMTNYAYTSLPKTIKTKNDFIREVNLNIEMIANKAKNTPEGFQKKIMYQLWKIANANGLSEVEDFIFNNYLKSLATSTQDEKIIIEIESKSKLRVGTIAPEITWSSNDKSFALSKMKDAKNFILIFWSSTCSHCLNELPELYEELKNYPTTKVLAYGLEDDKDNWEKVSATMPNFTHVLGLQKWENEYVKTFNIQQTPTYFILDNEKRIVAKPETYEQVLEFLKNKN